MLAGAAARSPFINQPNVLILPRRDARECLSRNLIVFTIVSSYDFEIPDG